MKEIVFDRDTSSETATFAACVATILELPLSEVPDPGAVVAVTLLATLGPTFRLLLRRS